MSSIVVLSRYPDIFEPLRQQLNEFESEAHKVLVTSGDAAFFAPGWDRVAGIEPFIFARNANLGLKRCLSDVLLLNDDVRISGPLLNRLVERSAEHPDIGLLAPQVDGGVGNAMQSVRYRLPDHFAVSLERLAFVAVLIPRLTLDRVGYLDERFVGYGGDDVDYSFRVQRAGLHLGVTSDVVVQHGHGGALYSSSFLRRMSARKYDRSIRRMMQVFREKWQLPGA